LPNLIVRTEQARKMLGIVGNTLFYESYINRGDGDEFVPGTDVRRLRPVQLGERAVGYLVDEIDALIEGLRRWRDANPPKPRQAIGVKHHETVAA
jgi:hypothetical protein